MGEEKEEGKEKRMGEEKGKVVRPRVIY